MAEPDRSSASTSASSTTRDSSGAGAASPSSSLNSSPVSEEEETHHNHDHDAHRFGQPELEHQNFGFAYRGNFFASDDAATVISDDTWSCIIVVLTFWFFG